MVFPTSRGITYRAFSGIQKKICITRERNHCCFERAKIVENRFLWKNRNWRANVLRVFDRDMREFSDIIRLSRKYLVTREFIGIPKISRGSNFASFRSSIRTNSKCWQTIVRPFNIGWYRFPVMLLFLEETRNIETFFQERISQVSPKRIMRYVNINIGEARKT